MKHSEQVVAGARVEGGSTIILRFSKKKGGKKKRQIDKTTPLMRNNVGADVRKNFEEKLK